MIDYFALSIGLGTSLTVVAIILTIKLAKKKKPSWAYTTDKIIGLGADAPEELKLTFNDELVTDVYQTTFIFFNRGNEAVRKEDVNRPITMSFAGAKILRPPVVKAVSKEEVEFVAIKRSGEDADSIELGFRYLNRNDGGVVEVLHTKAKDVKCSGDIIDATQINYIGEFTPTRWKKLPFLIASFIGLLATPMVAIVLLTRDLGSEEPQGSLGYLIFIIAITTLFYVFFIKREYPRVFGYRKFPKWSAVETE